MGPQDHALGLTTTGTICCLHWQIFSTESGAKKACGKLLYAS
jgi:hypothetical protein